MGRKAKAAEAPPGAPLYMATYGDMVTLILWFFVLLFAMSSVDFQKISKSPCILARLFGRNEGRSYYGRGC